MHDVQPSELWLHIESLHIRILFTAAIKAISMAMQFIGLPKQPLQVSYAIILWFRVSLSYMQGCRVVYYHQFLVITVINLQNKHETVPLAGAPEPVRNNIYVVGDEILANSS